jgi:hypothetical protein
VTSPLFLSRKQTTNEPTKENWHDLPDWGGGSKKNRKKKFSCEIGVYFFFPSNF